jgi:hypothetical protein
VADIIVAINHLRLRASIDVASAVGRSIYECLPIVGRFERWGDEICLPLDQNPAALANPVTTVQLGDIAYSQHWKMFCVFYGKTPLSSGDDIVPNGPVDVIGRLHDPHAPEQLRRFFAAYSTRITRRALKLISPGSAYGDMITISKS